MATLLLKPNLRLQFASPLQMLSLGWQCLPVLYRLKHQPVQAAQQLAKILKIKIELSGLEHLPQEPSLILPLHEGLLDVLALLHLPLTMRFAARSELFDWQFIGPIIAAAQTIKVDPEQGFSSYRRLLSEAKKVFETDQHLVIFPQGSVCGLEIDFQKGAFGLAKALNVPIVPIVLTGSHRVWDHPFDPTLHLNQRICLQILEPLRNPDRIDLQRQMKRLALEQPSPARRYKPQRDGFWDGYVLNIDPDYPEIYQEMLLHRQQYNGSAP